MNGKIIQTDHKEPDQKEINQAATIIKQGGVVVFPTWCLYGLAADAFNPDAIKRVFHIKKRPADNPVLILIKNRDELKKLVTDIPSSAQKIMDRFWPGRVTLIFNALSALPETLTAGTGKIGIRLPEHPTAMALVNELTNPITGTSANISGEKGCNNIKQMHQEVIQNTDMVLDSGSLKGGTGSTIIDVTCDPVHVIREGEVSSKDIFKALC